MPKRNLAPEFQLDGPTDVFHRQPFRGALPGELETETSVVDEATDFVRGTDSSIGDEAARAAQAAKLSDAGISPDHLFDASLPQYQALSVLVQGDKL